MLAHYDAELQRLCSEYAGLSGAKREALVGLLMEGDLLEVTMDEVHQLWQLLQWDAEYQAVFSTNPAKAARTSVKEEVCVGCVSEHVLLYQHIYVVLQYIRSLKP